MAERTRAVLVGCGGITRAWLGSRAMAEEVELVGLVDLRREAAEALRERHGLGGAVVVGTDLVAVLAATRPTVVFDLTVPEAHCAVTLTALAHGCHVLGEKPMAATLDEGRRMVAAAEAAGRLYAVTQTRRHRAQLRRLQRFLATGALGAIHTVTADFFIGAHFGGFRAAMDHVLLLDMAIHSFDSARLLTPGRPCRVQAADWNPPGSWFRHGASAWAAFTMEGGARLLYRGSWVATGLPTSWECSWRLQGDRGTASWDGDADIRAERLVDPDQPSGSAGGRTLRYFETVEVPPLEEEVREGHDGAIHDFLEALRSGRRPESDCRDNLLSLAMVHTAIASAERDGVPMPIEE